MVALDYGVFVTALDRWIDVPVFRGPITGMARDGDSIALTCLGKEHLAQGNAWRTLTLRKNMDMVAAIRTILEDRAGERSFAFPARGGKLPDQLSLGRMTKPWKVAQDLAKALNRQMFYDGAGVLQLRRPPAINVWTFADGDGGSVLSPPSVTYDLSTVSNAVWVKGKKPKGKPQVTATAVAPRSHPLSPWRLGREGVPRYLVAEVENDNIRSVAEARRKANSQLTSLLREGVEVNFDALPVPHLDPWDPVRLATADASLSFTLVKASIPLVHSGVMSVGTNRRVTPDPTRIRTRT
jgi:hypothetical protein